MSNYYDEKLNSQMLFQVYETAIPRISQYLNAEIDYVRSFLTGTESVIELGAGYGRIVRSLAPDCASILGIDISANSVALGKEYLKDFPNADMLQMDVHHLTLTEQYDVVLVLQNAISAIRMTDETIRSAFDLVKPGGKIFFSTYSANFWEERLDWFREQAEKKLLGELDMEQTKDGVIICKDGFRATTSTPEDYEHIGKMLGCPYEIKEVDGSSLFLVIDKV